MLAEWGSNKKKQKYCQVKLTSLICSNCDVHLSELAFGSAKHIAQQYSISHLSECASEWKRYNQIKINDATINGSIKTKWNFTNYVDSDCHEQQ